MRLRYLILGAMVGMWLVILGRLFWLTIINHSYYLAQAQTNQVQKISLYPKRGRLLDRFGQVLADSIMPKSDELTLKNLVAELVKNPLAKQPLERLYPCGMACSSSVGYVRSENETMVGVYGAEKEYQSRLMGKLGERTVEENANGRQVNIIAEIPPIDGEVVKLSVDKNLMLAMAAAFGATESGAIIAIEPKTGQILSLMSFPFFDPNQVGLGILDPAKPLLNRGVSGRYAPGSTFKLVTALAGLQDGVVNNQTEVNDTGVLSVNGYDFGNWLWSEHGRTEGQVNVVKAIARSNDIFFYQVGNMVGPEKISAMAESFGLGKNYGLESWGEISGLIPNPDWKLKTVGERWYLGNTYHMSIGQGDVLTTPLGIAMMTAAIANKGLLCKPTMLLEGSKNCQQLSIKDEAIETVIGGMTAACNRGGTGYPFFGFEGGDKVACKTGTAQQGNEKSLPHAWFTMFYPVENPQIVLTVFVEAAGQGSQVAAPIAKQVLESWLENKTIR